MKISEAIDILNKEKTFKRTSIGRPIIDEAVAGIQAALDDKKNWGSDVAICANCGIILSSLLVPEGCVNCGSKDLSIGNKGE